MTEIAMFQTQAMKPPVRAADAPRTDWWLASWDNWVECQRFWMMAMLPWHQGLIAAQRDWWERWTARWAGGVPIDA